MTRRLPLLLLLLLVLGGGLSVAPGPGTPSAAASCAGAVLEVRPDRVLGRTPRVTGSSFVDGCQDTMACTTGPGCDACTETDPPPVPTTDAELRLRQDDRVWRLGVTDADAEGDVVWRVRLPAGVRPGPARLIAPGAGGVPVRVAR